MAYPLAAEIPEPGRYSQRIILVRWRELPARLMASAAPKNVGEEKVRVPPGRRGRPKGQCALILHGSHNNIGGWAHLFANGPITLGQLGVVSLGHSRVP
jgi:hypothetical protein